jgi:hypothetical protein
MSFRRMPERQKPWNLKLIQEAYRDCHIGYIFACVAQITDGAGVRGHGGYFKTEYVLGCKLLRTRSGTTTAMVKVNVCLVVTFITNILVCCLRFVQYMRKVTYCAGSTNQVHSAVFCKLRFSDPTC